MAAFNKFYQFTEDLAKGVHDLSVDQLTLALSNEANPPVVGDAVLADIAQIAYTNLSSRDVNTISAEQTAGVLKLLLTDLVLTAGGGPVAPFRYLTLYNSAAAGMPLIGWYDYGSDLILADTETLTIDFDGTNGVLTIT